MCCDEKYHVNMVTCKRNEHRLKVLVIKVFTYSLCFIEVVMDGLLNIRKLILIYLQLILF